MNLSNLPISQAMPTVMHIDLNSCFAIIEQQANRLLRGKPVGVAAYATPRGFVLAASYQAKHLGIKLGVNVAEAREMCPGIIILPPDPAKYRTAHKLFKEVLLEYTSDVTPKSIDEFVLHLSGSPALRMGMSMEQIGLDIKQKIYTHLGEAVTVNVGIGPNRFLAKLAAGLHKPNGMDRIDHSNLESTFAELELMDFPGINIRYNRRLREWGINTPLQFLAADKAFLQKRVFKSIVGYYWYLRLRGFETDRFEPKQRSIGHQYALSHKTDDQVELAKLLLKLCEKVGRRLRKSGLYAGGIHLYLSFVNYQQMADKGNGFIGGENLDSKRSWHRGVKLGIRLYSTQDIYLASCKLLGEAEIYGAVRGISITVYDLQPADPEQLSLFEGPLTTSSESKKQTPSDDPKDCRPPSGQTVLRYINTNHRISDAIDDINNRYGEYVVTPGSMMDMKGTIIDRIAFGSVRDL